MEAARVRVHVREDEALVDAADAVVRVLGYGGRREHGAEGGRHGGQRAKVRLDGHTITSWT
jgi:hypothetical protein